MGLYLRRSVRVGPFRFNLSGSGIGVSCGIPGLRIGTGPRGNYIHAGRGGIYYRAAFPTKHAPRAASVFNAGPAPEIPPERGFDPTLGEFHDVDAGVSVEMQDVSSQSLLDELNHKRAKWRLTPVVAVALVITCSALYSAE